MLLFNEVLNKGFEGGNFIAGLASHMRQLLVAKDTATLPLLEVSAKTRERYCEQAKKCDTKFIYRAIKLCNECDQAYRQSHNKRLQVEICLIQCAQITAGDDTSGSGRCPEKILKPIFNVGALAQPVPSTHTATIQTQTGIAATQEVHAQSTIAPQAQNKPNTGAPRLTTLKIGQLGPSIRATNTTTAEHAQDTPAPVSENKQFTEDDILFQWNSYVERMPVERQAMKMRMKGMRPKLIDTSTFEIVANNTQIGQYLLNLQDSILETMRKALCNTNINMSVRIAKAYEVQHITSKPALYKKMVERNKNLQRLTELLDLEICN
jgi:DNA polymerase-3 subunit gamma/tau